MELWDYQEWIPAVQQKDEALTLSNSIPATIFNLSSVADLHASYNDIEGSLPMDLGTSLPKLQALAVGYNRFTGSIPGSLANVSSLVNIFVPGNQFTGKLLVFGQMPSLHRTVVSLDHLGNRKVTTGISSPR
ncbi:hypothetical protein RHMOL_Rhmol10G0131100 [Rhododendron molle]|uniref:Uncharacterized protein n=1 Tax=Rhododendron molle TaxID=49168 RepID=A0ACC0M2R3_RHOML|nr:hypothetical protein RHMOL_Rhmol10G0131100 [Rhododendron molle]